MKVYIVRREIYDKELIHMFGSVIDRVFSDSDNARNYLTTIRNGNYPEESNVYGYYDNDVIYRVDIFMQYRRHIITILEREVE